MTVRAESWSGQSPPCKSNRPRIGSIWQGGGMTVRVVDVWPDAGDEHGGDARVERLTGRRGLMKRPVKAGLISLKHFQDGGRMKPLEAARDSVWKTAIQDRYGTPALTQAAPQPPRSENTSADGRDR